MNQTGQKKTLPLTSGITVTVAVDVVGNDATTPIVQIVQTFWIVKSKNDTYTGANFSQIVVLVVWWVSYIYRPNDLLSFLAVLRLLLQLPLLINHTFWY